MSSRSANALEPVELDDDGKELDPTEGLPASDRIERALIGLVLRSHPEGWGGFDDARRLVLARMTPEDFRWPRWRAIFEAAQALETAGECSDPVSVCEWLDERGTWLKRDEMNEDVVADAWGHPDSQPTWADHWCRKARAFTMRRRLIVAGWKLGEAAAQHDDPESIMAEVNRDLEEIALDAFDDQPDTPSQAVAEVLDRITEVHDHGATPGVRTGLIDLDDVLGPLGGGSMVVMAARPSMGKTALAVTIGRRLVLAEEPTPVGLISLEMSRSDLMTRFIAQESRTPFRALMEKTDKPLDYQRVIEAAELFSTAPIFIREVPGARIERLRAEALRLKGEHHIEILFVDYLQLVDSGLKTPNTNSQVQHVSRSLKNLARELDIPVVVLSQLNRNLESRALTDRKPRLSDLRDSGAIEQDADVVLFVHRQEYYEPENQDLWGLGELGVCKNRNGRLGWVKVNWDKTAMEFRALAQ